MLKISRLASLAGLLALVACASPRMRVVAESAPASALEPTPQPLYVVDTIDGAADEVVVRAEVPAHMAKEARIRTRWATDEPGSGATETHPVGLFEIRLRDMPTARVWIDVALELADRRDGVLVAAWLEPDAASTRRVTVDFDRGHSLTGRLVDPDGRPLADREVTFAIDHPTADGSISYHARTDACGCFYFVGLGPETGTILVLRGQPRGAHAQVVYIQHEVVEDISPKRRRPLRVVLKPFDRDEMHGMGIS